ncbi:UNKNOWN [Stylonychia lemnae]|uniref:Uncharacterized protein n=1 Tax=Stylonychia lemnae TaxID=5949 RepID=A0A077ZUE9_STYLE|nr:UNKNOWN [Stylonychia lemnae]|eukprot:CDW73497.1 UNKNOWN [Stylonychia lemnae]
MNISPNLVTSSINQLELKNSPQFSNHSQTPVLSQQSPKYTHEPIHSISNINIKVKSKDNQMFDVSGTNLHLNMMSNNGAGGQLTDTSQNQSNTKERNRTPIRDQLLKKVNSGKKVNGVKQQQQQPQPIQQLNGSFKQKSISELRSNQSSLMMDRNSSHGNIYVEIGRTPSRQGSVKYNESFNKNSPSNTKRQRVLSQPHLQSVEKLYEEDIRSPNFNQQTDQIDQLIIRPQQGILGSGMTSGIISPMVSQRYDIYPNLRIMPGTSYLINRSPQLSNFSQGFQVDPAIYLKQDIILMQLKDQNEMFDITIKEIQVFRELKRQLKQKMGLKHYRMSGQHRQVMINKGVGHLNPNIRPKSANKLHINMDKKNKSKEFKNMLMSNFYQYLRAMGLGKAMTKEQKQLYMKQNNPPPKTQQSQNHGNNQIPIQANQQIKPQTGQIDMGTQHNLMPEPQTVTSSNHQNTYTVFKRLSRQYKLNQTGQVEDLTQQILSNGGLSDKNKSEGSAYHFSLKHSAMANISRQEQENIDLRNLININSIHSLGSQNNDQRPFSALTAQGQAILSQGKENSGAYGNVLSRYAQNFDDDSLERNVMRPVLTSHQTKKDASIQNDREILTTQEYASNSSPTINKSQLNQDLSEVQPTSQAQATTKPRIQSKVKIPAVKPLWIVSTSKQKRLNITDVQNKRGNLVYDYIQQAKKQFNRNENSYIDQAIVIGEKHEGLERLSTPSGCFALGQNISFDRSGINTLKMQTFYLDIKEDGNESQCSYVPKLQNSQIKRYFYGSNHKRKQSANDNDSSSNQNQDSKKKFYYKSINMDLQNNSFYQTPMFNKDGADFMIEGQEYEKQIQKKLSTLEAVNENESSGVQLEIISSAPESEKTAQQQTSKKNILISKKSVSPVIRQMSPPTLVSPTNQAIEKPMFLQQSHILIQGGSMTNSDQNQLIADPDQQDLVLLEHIREETGESFDSGHAESSHTMQSNFQHHHSTHFRFIQKEHDKTVNLLSKSYNNGHLLPMDDTEYHYLLQNQENKSLTQRDLNPVHRTTNTNSLTQIVNHSNFGQVKSKSINENHIHLLSMNHQHDPHTILSNRVIYKNRDRMVKKRSSSQKFHNQLLKQTIIDFTNININDGTQEEQITRNLSQMNLKKSSKTPTTRVISKIGGNTVSINNNNQGDINNSNINPHANINNNTISNNQQIPSNGESQSSYNGELQNAVPTLLVEREGFLETPRYMLKQGGKQTYVEINGLQQLQGMVAHHHHNHGIINLQNSMRLSGNSAIGKSAQVSNSNNFNEGTFMVQSRKESSFEINNVPSKAQNSNGLDLMQRSKDLYSVYNPNEISVKYNANKTKAQSQPPITNQPHKVHIQSKPREVKKQQEKSGYYLANLLEIPADIIPNTLNHSQNSESRSISSQNHNNIQQQQQHMKQAYLQHQRDYKIKQEKRYSEMLKRNISVLRRQKNRSYTGRIGDRNDPVQNYGMIVGIDQAAYLNKGMQDLQFNQNRLGTSHLDKHRLPYTKQVSGDDLVDQQYNSISTINRPNTGMDIYQSQKEPKILKQEGTVSPLTLFNLSPKKKTEADDEQNTVNISQFGSAVKNSVKTSPIKNTVVIKDNNQNQNLMSDAQIHGVSLQEYFKKKTDSSVKQREGANISKLSNNNLNHSFTPLYDLSVSNNESVMLSKLQVNQSDILNLTELNNTQRQIIRNKNMHQEFNRIKFVSDSREMIESATHVINNKNNNSMRSALQMPKIGSNTSNAMNITQDHSSKVHNTSSIFQKNKIFGVMSSNITPINNHNAMSKGNIRSSSSRYRFREGKQSNSNMSNTTHSQTNNQHFRGSSAISNSSLQLNGSHLLVSTRPQSKLSSSRTGGFFTPAAQPNKTNY